MHDKIKSKKKLINFFNVKITESHEVKNILCVWESLITSKESSAFYLDHKH